MTQNVNIFLTYYFNYFHFFIFFSFTLSQLIILYIKKPVNSLLNLIVLIIIAGTQLLVYNFEYYFVLLIIVYLGGIAILFLSAVMTLNNSIKVVKKPLEDEIEFLSIEEEDQILNEYSLEEKEYFQNALIENSFFFSLENFQVIFLPTFTKGFETINNIKFNNILFFVIFYFNFLLLLVTKNYVFFFFLFFYVIYLYFSKRAFFLYQVEKSIFNPFRFGNFFFFVIGFYYFEKFNFLFLNNYQLFNNVNFFYFLLILLIFSIFLLDFGFSAGRIQIVYSIYWFFSTHILLLFVINYFFDNLIYSFLIIILNLLFVFFLFFMPFYVKELNLFFLIPDDFDDDNFKFFFWNKNLDFFFAKKIFFCNQNFQQKWSKILMVFFEILRLFLLSSILIYAFQNYSYFDYNNIKKIIENDLMILLTENNQLNLTTNLAENLFLNYSFLIIIITFLLLIVMIGAIVLLLEPNNETLKTQDVNLQFNKIYKKTVFLKSTQK